MNRTITLIIGLPGSGKTEYSKTLPGTLVDDPRSLKEFPDEFEHLIVTDPNLCDSITLNKAITHLSEKYPDIPITKIYFENDPQQCLKNASRRENKPVNNSIIFFSKNYTIDYSCLVLPCWRES